MYRVTTSAQPRGNFLDVALPDPSNWMPPPFPMGKLRLAAALFGDDTAGPFAALYSNPPLDQQTPSTPGHGHGSDSWRIDLLGVMRVGAQRYHPGGFRFQEGGKLYGADDSPWGPEGGYSIVMMGDRRGTSAIAANPDDEAEFAESGRQFLRWLQMERPDTFDAPQGVATTLGMPRNGRVDGSFNDEWPDITQGVSFAAGLVGERQAGPIVILSKAKAGCTAFPALTIGCDVMHILVRGTARQGEDNLAPYGVRLVGDNVEAPMIIAGSDGLWLASVIGDRRAWPSAKTDSAGEVWLQPAAERIAELVGALGKAV